MSPFALRWAVQDGHQWQGKQSRASMTGGTPYM